MKSLAPLATIVFLTACRGEAPPVSPTPSPELESMIKQQAESAAPESEQVGALYRGVAYDRGESEEFRVETEAGQCYTFVAAGDPTVEVFDLRVWGKSKIPAARDKSKGREALVQYCPEETGVARFEGKVAKGAGHFAIGIFKKGAPEKVEVVEKSDKLDLDKLIADEAAAAAPGSKLENMYVAKGKQTDWYAQLKKGSCYWFIGAGQKDVDDFYIYLWDPKNSRIGQTKADSNKAQFGHCPTEDGMFHVQLKVDDDSDEAKVGVFSKPK
jgi:hypothetical protein